MTETKAPASKRQMIDDETPVPTLLETKAAQLLPVDVLAKALSFLSVLEIAPKIHKIAGVKEGVDFPAAMQRATKQITNLVFDSEWNRVLQDATARGMYAAHLKYKYLRSNIKTITVAACPSAMHERFMRSIADSFSGVETVEVGSYITGTESRGALRHLYQLPHLRRLGVVWASAPSSADDALLASIKSEELRDLSIGRFPEQLLNIPDVVLRGVTLLQCYMYNMEPFSRLLEKFDRLVQLACVPQLPATDYSALCSIVIKKCPHLELFHLNTANPATVSLATARILFGLKHMTSLRLRASFSFNVRENWEQWWTEAVAAWPSLESIETSIPMPRELLRGTMDVWPKLKTLNSFTQVALNADVVRAWSLKHPLCRVTNMNAIWMIGSDRISAEALADRLKGDPFQNPTERR